MSGGVSAPYIFAFALSDLLLRNPDYRTHRTWRQRFYQEPPSNVDWWEGEADEVRTNPPLVPLSLTFV